MRSIDEAKKNLNCTKSRKLKQRKSELANKQTGSREIRSEFGENRSRLVQDSKIEL